MTDPRTVLLDTLREYAEHAHPHRDHPALARKYELDVKLDLDCVNNYRDFIIAEERERIVKAVERLGAVHPFNHNDEEFINRSAVITIIRGNSNGL